MILINIVIYEFFFFFLIIVNGFQGEGIEGDHLIEDIYVQGTRNLSVSWV